MYFPQATSPEMIQKYVIAQAAAMMPDAKYGLDIEICQHKKQRTYRQNQFLAAIIDHIVRFCQETGHCVDGLSSHAMRADLLREWFKGKYSVRTTTKLSTKEFAEYCDHIQQDMVEQTRGEYEPIIPDDQMWATSEEMY
jgi:hypothetical protein